jgi:hypothetical protein
MMSEIKCAVCGNEALTNKVICSDHCAKIRLKIFSLIDKYFPTHGCDNCLGDLGRGCSDQCKKEFREAGNFSKDLWLLVNLVLTDGEEKKPDHEKGRGGKE